MTSSPITPAMAAETTAWKARDATVLWHGFTQMAKYGEMEPIVVESGEGCELIDVDGKRYLDAISSLWVTTLGHRIPELDQALLDQVGRIAHSTMLGNSNRVVIEFAEALCKVAPVEQAHVLFASDGASAVEQALKIAYQYWINRNESAHDTFLALGSAYHGDTIGALSLGDQGFATDIFAPLCFDVLRTPGYASAGWLQLAKGEIVANRDRLAAVIVEPLVQAASGMLIADPADVEELGRCCRTNGVLLIADEVATGFGRTGQLFASDVCKLHPDLMCLGKGITGGYLPMSATVASDAVFRAFCGDSRLTLSHGHSYGGNALGAAVGLAHLRLLEAPAFFHDVGLRAAHLRERLQDRVAQHRLVREIRQAGLLVGVELREPAEWNRPSGPLTLGQAVCASAVRHGVLLRPLGNVLPLVPPLTISAAEIDRLVDVLAGALDELLA
jgi:adenosylmethionine-8-amino-7-oxononanoate transaminase